MNSEKPKIFLSFAHEDIGMAERIYQDLKRYGLDVWFDNESLLPGQDWENEIEKAIEISKYFLVLLSSKGMSERGYVHKEIRLALNIFDRCPEDDIFMIPIRLDDCQPAHRRIKKINWINLFPESEYQNGLRKILQVVCKEALLLRNKPKALSEGDVSDMIRRLGFYDINKNPEGKGFEHKYSLQKINDDSVVFDLATGLMWQQSGTDKMSYEDAENWITNLNQKGFARFNDWRLPTLEEAMSLLEPEDKEFLIFDKKQEEIWTVDQLNNISWEWVVSFNGGHCYINYFHQGEYYVRAVRSGQSEKSD